MFFHHIPGYSSRFGNLLMKLFRLHNPRIDVCCGLSTDTTNLILDEPLVSLNAVLKHFMQCSTSSFCRASETSLKTEGNVVVGRSAVSTSSESGNVPSRMELISAVERRWSGTEAVISGSQGASPRNVDGVVTSTLPYLGKRSYVTKLLMVDYAPGSAGLRTGTDLLTWFGCETVCSSCLFSIQLSHATEMMASVMPTLGNINAIRWSSRIVMTTKLLVVAAGASFLQGKIWVYIPTPFAESRSHALWKGPADLIASVRPDLPSNTGPLPRKA